MSFSAQVFAWHPDGRLVAVSPREGIWYQSCVHPAGTHVVYCGGTEGPARIWCADVASGERSALSDEHWGAMHPVYSWDGERIAFASDRAVADQRRILTERMGPQGPDVEGIVVNLFVAAADGSGVRQVTSGPHRDWRPAFSPDGSHLAFVSDRSGVPRIWTVPADGSAEPRPLQDSGWGYRPWYTADGGSVVFFTDVDDRHAICRLQLGDLSVERLPNDDAGRSHGPFADPSGSAVLMHSTRETGSYSIWELPLDGGAPRMLRPPGFEDAMAHGTRSVDGVLTFDVPRP